MSLDPSHTGRSYPPTAPYQVGREKIREFATAIGASDPAHHDLDAARALGHRDLVAPPTFPVVVAAAAGQRIFDDPEIGVDYSRVVHGDQRFAYTRPVVAGDELVCASAIEEITNRAGHGFLTTRTEVTTTAGEPVVTVWSKIVVRGTED
ncbi:MaoC family dehydratase N-terminal domain-containing protein [Plantactinospora sp. GCM10030261]|uniref:FAS1-like dehydratase domain-containing protein n=1 Tax=Plantactinospora sp. GCM10030261 TaxID=3273420 RepID=UPI00360CD424